MQLTGKSKAALIIGLLSAFLIYTVFAIYPIIQSFYYSFMEWDGFSEMELLAVGIYNLQYMYDP